MLVATDISGVEIWKIVETPPSFVNREGRPQEVTYKIDNENSVYISLTV